MALFRRETQEEKRVGGFCVAFYLLILLLGVALGAVSWRERDSQSRNGPRLPEEPCFDYLSPSCSGHIPLVGLVWLSYFMVGQIGPFWLLALEGSGHNPFVGLVWLSCVLFYFGLECYEVSF